MLTPEQQAAIQAAREGQNVFMPSTAGSGKSFTLRQIAQAITGQSLYVTFARNNADEARAVMPKHVTCASFHALGYRAMTSYFRAEGVRMVLNEHKLQTVYRTPLALEPGKTWPDEADTTIARFLAGLHDMLGNLDLTPTPEHITQTLSVLGEPLDDRAARAYQHLRGRDLEDPRFLAQIISWGRTEARRLALKGEVTFQECLTLPLELNLVRPLYAWVLVDECQDLNRIQHAWVRKLGKRYVLAGDRYQAIMAFTGSSMTLMYDLAEELGCVTRPLSVTFRCPVQHVALARRFTDRIDTAPGAAEGEVIHVPEHDMEHVLRGGDFILARNNATLFGAAFRMARAGFPVMVRGRDLVGRMISTLRRAISDPDGLIATNRLFTLEWLRARLDPVLADLTAELEIEERRSLAERRIDILECALSAAEEAAREHEDLSLDRIREQADVLFQSFPPHVSLIFMTVHGSKGLEANRVAILRPDLMPHPHAVNPDEEDNLRFVALTRSKGALIFLHALPEQPEWTLPPEATETDADAAADPASLTHP